MSTNQRYNNNVFVSDVKKIDSEMYENITQGDLGGCFLQLRWQLRERTFLPGPGLYNI